jgi:hypothetical protein
LAGGGAPGAFASIFSGAATGCCATLSTLPFLAGVTAGEAGAMELEKSESSTISFGAAGVVTFSAVAAGFASTGAASIKRST